MNFLLKLGLVGVGAAVVTKVVQRYQLVEKAAAVADHVLTYGVGVANDILTVVATRSKDSKVEEEPPASEDRSWNGARYEDVTR